MTPLANTASRDAMVINVLELFDGLEIFGSVKWLLKIEIALVARRNQKNNGNLAVCSRTLGL